MNPDENPEPESEEPLIDDPAAMPDRRVWLWVSIAVALLVAAGIGAPYGYKAAKVYRAKKLIAGAKEAFGKLDFTNGTSRLRSAVVLAPDENEVLRMAAETLALLGSADSLNYWGRLEQKGDFTPHDRINRARTALGHGRFDVAGSDLEKLYSANPTNTEVLGLSIDFFQRLGNPAKAREAAAELLRVDPGSKPGQLAAGGLLASDATSVSNRFQGRQMLMQLARTEGSQQTNAWQLLATLGDLEATNCIELARILTNRPSPGLDHVLSAAEFARRADTNSVTEWIPRVIGSARASKESAAFAAASVWLLDRGQQEALIQMLPLEETLKSGTLLPVLLQAYSQSGDFQKIREVVENTAAALNPFDRALYRGTLSLQTGKNQDAESQWMEAQNLATNRFLLRRLADTTTGAGFWRIAASSWQRLIPMVPNRLEAAAGFLRTAQRSRDTRLSLDAHKKFLEVVPNDFGIRTEAAYLQLVLGEKPEQIMAELDRFPEELKKSDRIQFLVGFGQLRSGKESEGLATLERSSVDWSLLEPRWKALYAALLSANGQREAARRYGSMVKPTDLTSSERECFSGWVPSLR
jgi:hypothetical protein